MRGTVPALVTAVVLLLAGCSGGYADSESAGDDPTESESSAATDTKVATDDTADDTFEPAARDLANFDCRKRKNARWTASGNITSSAGEPMTYRVTVVAVEGGNKVVGERIKKLEVRPDQTVTFTFDRVYVGDADMCIPRVERIPA